MVSEYKQRMQHIRDVLSHKPYNYLALLLSVPYAVITAFAVIYIHGSLALFYTSMYRGYTLSFTILTLIISVLTGIAITLFIAKIKELRHKSAGLGLLGLFFGGLAAGCPGCFFGLFPFILSFFGISATLAILPFNGVEFQLLTVFLMLFAIWGLGKETVVNCKLPKKKKL